MIAASSKPLPSGVSGVRCAEMSANPGRFRSVATAAAVAVLAASGRMLPLAATTVALGATVGMLAFPAGDALAAETKAPSTEVLRDSRFDNGVVAVVDGDPITLRELKKYGQNSSAFLPPEVRN